MLLKGRGRANASTASVPPHLAGLTRTPQMNRPQGLARAPLAKPEPDYEVVEYPSDQYVNAKLQPPLPPRPPTGHPAEVASTSCGLCGGGGARVRCGECGRRALCASCDDMYHRHPKRRHHQRQTLSPSQLIEVRPPLPPKASAPVPPPRRHKLSGDRSSASPRPPASTLDQRRATVGQVNNLPNQAWSNGQSMLNSQAAFNQSQPALNQAQTLNHGQPFNQGQSLHHVQATLNHVQPSFTQSQHTLNQPSSLNHGSLNSNQQVPQQFQPTAPLHGQPLINQSQMQFQNRQAHMGSMPYLPAAVAPPIHSTIAHNVAPSWARPKGFNVPQNYVGVPTEPWESPDSASGHMSPSPWSRPMRRGASVLDLGGCSGCAHCAAASWRYGSCTSLEHPWQGGWQGAPCCAPHASHAHHHPATTPLPYRRVDSRAVSRAASRTCSRAASPAMSSRSRTSRRTKHRTPTPPSSDADSESESDRDRPPAKPLPMEPPVQTQAEDDGLGPVPPPPNASWQCEHCTFVNEPGVRVCSVCCRTPVVAPKIVQDVENGVANMKIETRPLVDTRLASPPVKQNGGSMKSRSTIERTSTGCGPSPPRENQSVKPMNRLVTPNRESSAARVRNDMGVGPSPPRETKSSYSMAVGPSPPRDIRSPYREPIRRSSLRSKSPSRHNASIGPSPPRDNLNRTSSFKQTSSYRPERTLKSSSSSSLRANVSTAGTSPTPQNISTQTYETTNWDRERELKLEKERERERQREIERERERERRRELEREMERERQRELERGRERELERDRERAPSASRGRRRRDERRERSLSRHSLSSDTRESDRSAATAGESGGRWEWRSGRSDRHSPTEWSGSDRRLPRRASHLDLRHIAPHKSVLNYSQTASPEPSLGGRAVSLEALAGGGLGEAARGLELARLMTEAERLGASAAEVHAALAQNPLAPLAWLRERWPSLVAGVRAASARLAPGLAVSEREARAALARHRGALWPAVNECVQRHQTQVAMENAAVSSEAGHGGRVWGSPAGADDDAAPARGYDSSDEFEATPTKYRDDDWMYLPRHPQLDSYNYVEDLPPDINNLTTNMEDETLATLNIFLKETANPSVNEDLLLKRILADSAVYPSQRNKRHSIDFLQSENDFIDAYNALARSEPLPINKNIKDSQIKIKLQELSQQLQNTNVVLDQQPNVYPIVETQKEPDPKFEEEIIYSENGKSLQDYMPDINLQEQENEDVKNHVTSNEASSSKEPSKYNSQTNLPKYPVSHEERGNNLNEIVDNTQRLIQQMKEEINSDITSLDEHSLSQSETENSSNESEYSSEQRSSSTETERETDDLSSDENETENKRSKKSNSVINRTSSEDNEQFEEALDHIEEKTESYRQANIDILNSIARSLQEEHTISIEINEHKDLQVMEPMPEPEEIIVQATDTINQNNITNINIESESNRTVQVEPDNTLGEPVITKIEPIKPASKAPKQDWNNNKFSKVNSFEEIYDDLHTSTSSVPPNFRLTPVRQIKKPINIEKQEIIISTFRPESPHKIVLIDQKQPIFNALLDENTTPEEVNNNEDVTVTPNLNNRSTTPNDNNPVEKDQISIRNSRSRSGSSRNSISPINQTNDNIDNPNDHTDTNLEEITAPGNSINDTYVDSSNYTNTTPMENRGQSESSEKSTPSANTANNMNRITSMLKSNIPKLVKLLPNKQRGDKNAAKVISSKVPVRRGSIKQHAAPAPPKSHFGNVQNGHVKQLRTKLFNEKPVKTTVKSLPVFDPTPSTSYSLKKRQAPQPPTQPDINDSVPSTPEDTPKERSYFRETCRTEDEWTDSDSGDSQPVRKISVEEPMRVPTPPPPVTVRRVSGQLVDLARVRLLEGSPERQARMLLADGALENWEQAQLAVELVSRGTEPPSALLAALECIDLNSALVYLHQECELCASKFPEHEMVSMLCCTHRCCRECARHYFTVQITERSIADCVCPYCKEPELQTMSEDAWLEYFAHLDILLKTLLEHDTHELFQRKLRDRTLALDPNFKWCVECSSGFFVHPKQKRLRCPECRSVSCATCRKPWTSNHDGLTCEQYAKWVEDNDPERSVMAVQQHLKENGLECPRCHFKYSLSRGGCMHFTCTQCKFEFCYGCGKPFTMGARCGLSEYCAKLGLHAHHPRNCLFYLRDKEPHDLQTLLQMNNVPFETEAPEGAGKRCPVQLQKETPTGLVDTSCGGDVPDKHAGLCKLHYVEYLALLARGVDPLPIMDVAELVAELRRRALPLPERGPWDTDPIYAGMCAEIVKEKIPLE